MASLLLKGVKLERRLGSAWFLYLLSVFSLLTGVVYLLLEAVLTALTDDQSYSMACAVGFSGTAFSCGIAPAGPRSPGDTFPEHACCILENLKQKEMISPGLLVCKSSFVFSSFSIRGNLENHPNFWSWKSLVVDVLFCVCRCFVCAEGGQQPLPPRGRELCDGHPRVQSLRQLGGAGADPPHCSRVSSPHAAQCCCGLCCPAEGDYICVLPPPAPRLLVTWPVSWWVCCTLPGR